MSKGMCVCVCSPVAACCLHLDTSLLADAAAGLKVCLFRQAPQSSKRLQHRDRAAVTGDTRCTASFNHNAQIDVQPMRQGFATTSTGGCEGVWEVACFSCCVITEAFVAPRACLTDLICQGQDLGLTHTLVGIKVGPACTVRDRDSMALRRLDLPTTTKSRSMSR